MPVLAHSYAHFNTPPGGTGTMTVTAHSDDDILFCAPDLIHAVQSGDPYRFVCLTAGDAGGGTSVMTTRENASKAAYANIAGVANSWSTADAGITGHASPLYTLTAAPQVSLVFLRLPDGNIDGTGFAASGNVGLQKLYTGNISSVTTLDSASSYTLAQLVTALAGLITAAAPAQILTSDYAGYYGDGDHSDHHTTGFLARAALAASGAAATLTGYEDYNTQNLPANVTGADLTAKNAALAAYNAVYGITTTWAPYQYAVAQEGFPPAGIRLVQQACGNASSNAVTVALSAGHRADGSAGSASTAGNTLIVVGRAYTSGGTDAVPTAITDTSGSNTWHFSSSIASNPPSDTLTPGSHSGVFVAWALAAASVTSVTVTVGAGAGYTECSVSEWSGISSETAGGTVENDTAAARIVSPSLTVPAGGLAAGIAYPAAGTAAIGSTRPAGAAYITLPLQQTATGGPDAANWAAWQVIPAGGTLAWDWGASAASVQAAAVFAP